MDTISLYNFIDKGYDVDIFTSGGKQDWVALKLQTNQIKVNEVYLNCF